MTQEQDVLAFFERIEVMYNEASSAADLDRYLAASYENSPHARMIVSYVTSCGYEEVRRRHHETFPAPQRRTMGELRMTDLQVSMLGDEFAHVAGKWTIVTAAGLRGGEISVVVHLTPDGWRIRIDHTVTTSRSSKH